MASSYKTAKAVKLGLTHIVLISLSVFFLIPFFWMISTSLKPLDQTMVQPPVLIPSLPDTVPDRNSAHPYYQTTQPMPISPNQTQPTLVEADFVAREPNGKIKLKVAKPWDLVGNIFEADPSTLREIDKQVPVATGTYKGRAIVGKIIDEHENGLREISITSPASLAGQTYLAKSADIHLVRHLGGELDNYSKAFTYNSRNLGYVPFLYYFRNTILLCWLCVVGTTISSALVAYAFARLKFPGRELFFALTLATMMIPFPVLMVPTYALFKWLGWIGTFRPLWVPAFFGSAFNIFLLRQFFRGIPFELSEAAKLDGASEWRTFIDVILPLAKPALAVVALFTFMATWTDFLGPLIYLMDDKTFTLSLGLQSYQSQNGGTDWNLLMAATTIVVLPVVVLFFFTQKLFIRGIALTGLKG